MSIRNIPSGVFNSLYKRYKVIQKIYYGKRYMNMVFTDIWRNNKWYGKESVSGTGSDLFQTRIVRKNIPLIIKKYKINSLLDIPCGDFNWMRTVDVDLLKKYIGADIIDELVESNNKKYGNKKRVFM